MIDKAYLEITNVCNLSCSFCHGTKRTPRFLTREEFELLTDRLAGIRYLWFHLMGEPLLHPDLGFFLRRAREKGFRPMITTNGTLLSGRRGDLLAFPPHKISVSLHAPEANGAFASPDYLSSVFSFARDAADAGVIVALRLWNRGGSERGNPALLDALSAFFPGTWQDQRSGKKLRDRVFLEYGEYFRWPDPNAPCPTSGPEAPVFCYALRDQIGVLSDGTVVPCCLDAEGAVPLGDLFSSPLADILASPRARALYDGFTAHRAAEPLCRTCGYAEIKKYRG